MFDIKGWWGKYFINLFKKYSSVKTSIRIPFFFQLLLCVLGTAWWGCVIFVEAMPARVVLRAISHSPLASKSQLIVDFKKPAGRFHRRSSGRASLRWCQSQTALILNHKALCIPHTVSFLLIVKNNDLVAEMYKYTLNKRSEGIFCCRRKRGRKTTDNFAFHCQFNVQYWHLFIFVLGRIISFKRVLVYGVDQEGPQCLWASCFPSSTLDEFIQHLLDFEKRKCVKVSINQTK